MNYYLIGIKGSGMSALASILHDLGNTVVGYDDSIEYKPGDKVEHVTFGTGVVVSVEKTVLNIAFPHPTGIKTIMKGHKSRRKV